MIQICWISIDTGQVFHEKMCVPEISLYKYKDIYLDLEKLLCDQIQVQDKSLLY